MPTNNPMIPCSITPPMAPIKIIIVGACNPFDNNIGFKKSSKKETIIIYTVNIMF